MLSGEQEKLAKEIIKDVIFINMLDPANTIWDEDYIDQISKARIGALNITTGAPWLTLNEMLINFTKWHDVIKHNNKKLGLVLEIEDINRLNKKHIAGVIMGVQGLDFLNSYTSDTLRLLKVFYNLGLRVAGLTYQYRNFVGNGVGERRDDGLSKFGLQVVEELNRLGIVIDLSHAGKKTSMETMETSKDPVIFSHSNVFKLCPHMRNMDDEMIKKVAEKKGVICLCILYKFIKEVPANDVTLDDLIDHIDYIRDLVGLDYVAWGLDVYPPTTIDFYRGLYEIFPEAKGSGPIDNRGAHGIRGFDDHTEWPNVVRGLVKRDFSKEDIIKIMGGNALRVLKEVWK